MELFLPASYFRWSVPGGTSPLFTYDFYRTARFLDFFVGALAHLVSTDVESLLQLPVTQDLEAVLQLLDNSPLLERCGIYRGACLENVSINPASLLVREVSFYSSYGCDMDEFRQCIELVRSGRVDVNPVISGTVSQDELPQALERLCSPNDDVKLVLEME